MKIGDLVRCRPRDPGEDFSAWLGIIIGELPAGPWADATEYKTVQWMNSEDRNALETVNHKAKDLVAVNENR